MKNDSQQPDKNTEKQSPLDTKLQNKLKLLIQRIQDPDKNISLVAQTTLCDEICAETSSMTSIPKPLKYLHAYFNELKSFFEEKTKNGQKLTILADILSCISIIIDSESRHCLNYRLLGSNDLEKWGHEYIRHLSGELSSEFIARFEMGKTTTDLDFLVNSIVRFYISHNAESDACDLLMDVDQLELLSEFVSDDICDRVCTYLIKCSHFVADYDEFVKLMQIVFSLYIKSDNLPNALRAAIKLDDKNLITLCFKVSTDSLVTKQLALIAGSHKLCLDIFDEDEEIMELLGNSRLNEHFLNLAKELNVSEAKLPEDVYKSHLSEGFEKDKGNDPGIVDSAKENLASTFVNAFINAGSGKDALITPEDSDWIYKNKDNGMLSAGASLGLLYLWDMETGFSAIDRFSFSSQDYIKAGVLMANGILSSGITSDMDAAYALLCDHIESSSYQMKLSAIIGLGIAYAGSARSDVFDLLQPIIIDPVNSFELVSFAALSLGLVFSGTRSDEACGSIMQILIDRPASDLSQTTAYLLCIGLAFIYLSSGEDSEAIMEAISIIEHPINKIAKLFIQICSFVGTGNVLQIQNLLSMTCVEKGEKKKKEGDQSCVMDCESVAVIGIAMIAMGEDIGVEMACRTFDNLLQYGELSVRRAIPLALSIMYISNPNMSIIETLSKLSHDQDEHISLNAILSLGFVGAGTNNSRISKMLRHLAVFYKKEPDHLFLTRISQGLVHLGKGLLSLNPFHSDGMLFSKVSFAGLFIVITSSLCMKQTILSHKHYLLYYLTPAIRPKMLITLDSNLKPLPVNVRVGQAVDTVRQAGNPKTITGFQTHTTPVLIGSCERAELATDRYVATTSVLEGFVILKTNPDCDDDEEMSVKE